jgi:hypothetical protein
VASIFALHVLVIDLDQLGPPKGRRMTQRHDENGSRHLVAGGRARKNFGEVSRKFFLEPKVPSSVNHPRPRLAEVSRG